MKRLNEYDIEGERFDEPYARVVKHLAAPWTLGTTKIWLAVSTVDPRSCSNAHTHDDMEEVFYVVSGY